MRKLPIFPLVFAVLILTACGTGPAPHASSSSTATPSTQSIPQVISPASTPTEQNPAAAQSGNAYPAPAENATVYPTENDGYPAPDANATSSTETATAGPFVVPTVIPGKALITGQMLTPGPGGKPYTGDLFLATAFYATGNSNLPPMLKFSETDSPHAIVDANGNFYITNINPGSYALVVYSPAGTYFITGKDGNTNILKLNAGEKLDVGILSIK